MPNKLLFRKFKILIFVALIFLLIELAFMFSGNKPGYFYQYKNFNTTQPIETYHLYKNDESGILTVNPIVHQYLKNPKSIITTKKIEALKLQDGIDKLIIDYSILKKKQIITKKIETTTNRIVNL